jgi:periplasmic divalent cation tolerance protein
MTDVLVVLCSCGTHKEALAIGRSLIEAQLAACVNVLPSIDSVYRWQGKVETAQEALLVIKTTQQRFLALKDRITHLHTYDTPEIIAMPVAEASDKYLAWIRDQV